MANRWLFAGLDRGMLRASSITGTITSDASWKDAAYTDHSLSFSGTASAIVDFTDSAGASDAAVTGETLFFMAYMTPGSSSTPTGNIFELLDDLDQPWFALRYIGNGNKQVCYNSGTGGSPSWTSLGTINVWADGYFVLRLQLGSPHTFEVFMGPNSVLTGTFTQASLTRLDALKLSNVTNTGYWSQVGVTVGYSLVGGRIFYGIPNGAGSNSGMSGAHTDVDDTGGSALNDADYLTSTAAAQRSTFAFSNVPTLTAGQSLGDIFYSIRGKQDGSSPTQVKPVRRTSGGTDNVGSAVTLGFGFGNVVVRYTGLTEAEYNASEFGAESAG